VNLLLLVHSNHGVTAGEMCSWNDGDKKMCTSVTTGNKIV